MAQPSFSIIVPTYGRPDRLADCVQSVSALQYERDRLELIVVDDGTEDGARVEAALRPFEPRLRVQLLRQQHAGPAAARNRGAQAATGDYLAFTDDDCQVEPGWLAAFARQFTGAPRCIAGGETINALTDNIFTTASETLVAYFRDYNRKKGAPFFATNNIALPKEVFAQVEGFDERFPLAAGEDRDFCARCHQQGHEMVFVPGAQVRHYHALSCGRFFRQHFNYGRGAFFYHKIEAARGSRGKLEVEPLRFYFDLIRYPLTIKARRGIRLALLMFLSQAANTSGFFVEKSRDKTGPALR